MIANLSQKVFIGCGILVLVAFGAYLHSNSKISDQEQLAQREAADYKKVKAIGQLIYNHLQEVRAQNSSIDANQRGQLDMSQILKLCKKHNLKAPANSKESLSVKRTYQEKVINLKLRDEMLKQVIEFFLDVEALGNVKVSKVDIIRNPKNPDLWNIDATIVRRLKKEDENS
jgi:hypothetical protein